MNIIVPLAGPDFISSDGQLKSLIRYRDDYLTHYIIRSRPWYNNKNGHNLVFILFDSEKIRNFVKSFLLDWFPKAKILYISDYTQGAALTALSACSMFDNPFLPLCIDLADIDYQTDLDPMNFFEKNQTTSAIAITFCSNKPEYSYFLVDEFSDFMIAKEKEVISTNASVGTYIFRNTSTYVEAMSKYLLTSQKKLKNNLYYVAPMFNFISDAKKAVKIYESQLIQDIKFK
jgi:hypothetical protein